MFHDKFRIQGMLTVGLGFLLLISAAIYSASQGEGQGLVPLASILDSQFDQYADRGMDTLLGHVGGQTDIFANGSGDRSARSHTGARFVSVKKN